MTLMCLLKSLQNMFYSMQIKKKSAKIRTDFLLLSQV